MTENPDKRFGKKYRDLDLILGSIFGLFLLPVFLCLVFIFGLSRGASEWSSALHALLGVGMGVFLVFHLTRTADTARWNVFELDEWTLGFACVFVAIGALLLHEGKADLPLLGGAILSGIALHYVITYRYSKNTDGTASGGGSSEGGGD